MALAVWAISVIMTMCSRKGKTWYVRPVLCQQKRQKIQCVGSLSPRTWRTARPAFLLENQKLKGELLLPRNTDRRSAQLQKAGSASLWVRLTKSTCLDFLPVTPLPTHVLHVDIDKARCRLYLPLFPRSHHTPSVISLRRFSDFSWFLERGGCLSQVSRSLRSKPSPVVSLNLFPGRRSPLLSLLTSWQLGGGLTLVTLVVVSVWDVTLPPCSYVQGAGKGTSKRQGHMFQVLLCSGVS